MVISRAILRIDVGVLHRTGPTEVLVLDECPLNLPRILTGQVIRSSLELALNGRYH